MKRGFTIVELAIVIVVVLLLATIVTLGYRSAQDDSRDTARRAAVQQIEQAVNALKLWTDSQIMVGGYRTTVLGLDSNGLCQYNSTTTYTSNTNSNWLYYKGAYPYFPCTLGQSLIANGLLSEDFFQKIPERDDGYAKHSQMEQSTSMVLYSCNTSPATSRKWILYYYLKSPTAEESASVDALWNSCATTSPTLSALKTTLGMKAAVELNL